MWVNIILVAVNLALVVFPPLSWATPLNALAAGICAFGAYDSYLFNRRFK